VDAGSEVNYTNKDGLSALNLAILADSKIIIESLMKKANVRANEASLLKTLIKNYQQLTQSTAIAEYFITEKRFKTDISTIFLAAKCGWKKMFEIIGLEECFNARDLDGWTILHFAASSGKVIFRHRHHFLERSKLLYKI